MSSEPVEMSLDSNWFRERFALRPLVAPVSTGDGQSVGNTAPTSAAVLVPVIDRRDGLTILFTRRGDHLKSHPGQISFPGGRAEVHDASPVETALRESAEEIGLDRTDVEVLGNLADYLTVSGYRVTPVVALVRPPTALRPDPAEVAEIFEVPLDYLLDTANHQRNTMIHDGQERRYFAIPYGRHYIWGATAAMLMNLHRRLVAEDGDLRQR